MPAIQTIKFRRGTATQWSSANPVLAAGEMGVETDTRKFKFGNGSSQWSSISYASAGGSAGGGFFVAETEPVGPNIGDIWYCTSDTGNIAGKSFIRYDGYWVELNPGTLGPAGANGTNGAAATIAVGTVTTGAAGSSATVTNTGTSGAAVFAFSIPQGIQGIQGPTANIDEFVNLQVIGAY
jgi:hypothetical protein